MAAFPITKQDVLDFASELSILTSPVWLAILSYVNAIDLSAYCDNGDDTTLARLNLAAHFGAVLKRGKKGAAGPVTAESVGAIRRSYGLIAQPGGAAWLNSTGYGQTYLGILAMNAVHGPFLP